VVGGGQQQQQQQPQQKAIKSSRVRFFFGKKKHNPHYRRLVAGNDHTAPHRTFRSFLISAKSSSSFFGSSDRIVCSFFHGSFFPSCFFFKVREQKGPH